MLEDRGTQKKDVQNILNAQRVPRSQPAHGRPCRPSQRWEAWPAGQPQGDSCRGGDRRGEIKKALLSRTSTDV